MAQPKPAHGSIQSQCTWNGHHAEDSGLVFSAGQRTRGITYSQGTVQMQPPIRPVTTQGDQKYSCFISTALTLNNLGLLKAGTDFLYIQIQWIYKETPIVS